jgi:hypothetical protein
MAVGTQRFTLSCMLQGWVVLFRRWYLTKANRAQPGLTRRRSVSGHQNTRPPSESELLLEKTVSIVNQFHAWRSACYVLVIGTAVKTKQVRQAIDAKLLLRGSMYRGERILVTRGDYTGSNREQLHIGSLTV